MKDSDLIFGVMAATGRKSYSIDFLKYLIEPFDISDTSLRTTLSRMKEKKVLFSKKGKNSVYYSFADKGGRIGNNVSFSFKNPNWEDWDQSWWGFLYSLPSKEKALRHKVRSKLTAYRFVPLYPGYWIRPFNKAESIPSKLSDISSGSYGYLTKSEFITCLSTKKIQSLWKTREINNDFKNCINTIKESLSTLKTATSKEAFCLKMLTGDKVVRTLFKDPLLPECFLQEDWKGKELRNDFFCWEKNVSEKAYQFINKGD